MYGSSLCSMGWVKGKAQGHSHSPRASSVDLFAICSQSICDDSSKQNSWIWMEKNSQQNGSTRDQRKNPFIYFSDHWSFVFILLLLPLITVDVDAIIHRPSSSQYVSSNHPVIQHLIISSVIIHPHPTISFIISIIHYSDSSSTLKTAGYLPSQTSMRLVPFAWSSLGQVGDGRISMHLTFTDCALLDWDWMKISPKSRELYKGCC